MFPKGEENQIFVSPGVSQCRKGRGNPNNKCTMRNKVRRAWRMAKNIVWLRYRQQVRESQSIR
jgi:hypothetical protein